ncbi:hypothetical protein N7540_008613 [Penicillium herquei]|nr:hypothetical protein N7540_008613 [Penicillium herquei]
MPDMPAVFHQASSPPKLDLSSVHSSFFQVPASSTASSSLYSLSVSRKRPRRDTGKLSSKFDFEPPVHAASPLFRTDRQPSEDFLSAELDYRPNRYRESFLPPSLDASVDSIAADPYGTSRKRSRRDSCIASPTADDTPDTPDTAARRLGWGRTVINAVGRVLDLCWSGAFKGFYAGGGQGYDMAAGSPAQINTSWQPSPQEKETQILSTPIPGQYPDEDIDRSWVVVPTEPNDPFGDDENASPCVKARRIHQASSPRRRQAVMPKLPKRQIPSMRPSTPSRIPTLATPRSRDGPKSAEMQRHAARLRRKEREEDASIQRLNKQLQDMIRQGKEALGTTVQVDDLDMDFDSS